MRREQYEPLPLLLPLDFFTGLIAVETRLFVIKMILYLLLETRWTIYMRGGGRRNEQGERERGRAELRERDITVFR